MGVSRFLIVFLLGVLFVMPASLGAEETPKRFSFSLLFGPYRPDQVAVSDAGRDWEDFYGKDHELFSGIEWDWEVLQKYGILSVGGGAAFVQADGHSLYSEGGSFAESPEKLTFRIIPLTVNVTYRLSILKDQIVVPYVRAGFGTYLFRESKSGDTTISGYRNGYHFGGGLALLLDFINPDNAVSLDLDFGINNTYLVFEYRSAFVDDFGKELDFDFSTQTWFGGILFEY